MPDWVGHASWSNLDLFGGLLNNLSLVYTLISYKNAGLILSKSKHYEKRSPSIF